MLTSPASGVPVYPTGFALNTLMLCCLISEGIRQTPEDFWRTKAPARWTWLAAFNTEKESKNKVCSVCCLVVLVKLVAGLLLWNGWPVGPVDGVKTVPPFVCSTSTPPRIWALKARHLHIRCWNVEMKQPNSDQRSPCFRFKGAISEYL